MRGTIKEYVHVIVHFRHFNDVYSKILGFLELLPCISFSFSYVYMFL